MNEHLTDQELKELFQTQLPPVELPPAFAADLRRRVMSDVAQTLRDADASVAWTDGNGAPAYAAPQRAAGKRRAKQSSWWENFTDWLGNLRLLPSLAVAGATIALLVLFVRYTPDLLDSLIAPPSVQTGAGPVDAPVLQPITGALSADVTVSDGAATLVLANGRTQDLISGSTAAIAPGDSLLTLSGVARIDYFDGQYTIMQPGSRIELLELNTANDGTQVASIVHIGSTRHAIETPLDETDRFQVRTPSSYASAVGTEFIVEVQSADVSYYATLEGTIVVTIDDRPVTVAAGEQLTAIPGQEPVVQTIEPQEVAQADETPTEVVDAPTETPEPTATNTPEPTATETPEPTATNTPQPTATETPEPTATNTPEPTATNTPEPTATNTPEPTATNTPRPTATNTPLPTFTPTATPTVTPTPTEEPRVVAPPTATPTETPIPVVVKLVSPNDRVSGTGDQLFRWSTNVTPSGGQAFELIFWRDGENPMDRGFGVAALTRGTSVVVDLTMQDDLLRGLLDPGEYRWGVLLVEEEPYKRLELVSDTRLFRYSGSQSSTNAPGYSGE